MSSRGATERPALGPAGKECYPPAAVRLELLIFDLLLLGPPLVASFGRSGFLASWVRAWAACWLITPALWLLLAATADQLHVDPAHSWLPGPLGLPPGLWLLPPIAGFAALFAWRTLFAAAVTPARAPAHARAQPQADPQAARQEHPPPRRLLAYLPPAGLLALGGLGVAGLSPARDMPTLGASALLALGLLVPLELALRQRELSRRRFAGFLAAIAVLTVVLVGWPVLRGLIEWSPAAISGRRVIGVPVELIGLAMAGAGATVLAFETLEQRAAARPRKGLLARWIERRFGGYRHRYHPPGAGGEAPEPDADDDDRPHAVAAPRRVCVVGAGLAGMAAATKLAERGFNVVLLERNPYLGGKLGAWPTDMADGRRIGMHHGFHAFFGQYYNFNAFLSQLGIDRSLKSIGDYVILTQDGRRFSFKDVATTPMVNLLSLARHGVYRFGEVAGRHTGPKMEALLRFDPETCFAEWDEVSYAQFAADARLPDSLGLVFNTFARAFFADADKMSMAELIKSFHFFYLSNDAGLVYDHLDDDYERALLAPLRTYMERHAVDIRTDCPVGEIGYDGDSGRFIVLDESFDHLVIASDVVGTRSIFAASPQLRAAAPQTAAKAESLRPGQRYSVWRLWLDRSLEHDLPGFVITERERLLDAVTFVDQVEAESRAWVESRRAEGRDGGVFELHCYAVPEDLPAGEAGEAAIREWFWNELLRYFPDLAGAESVHEAFYVRRDFPAFHVGQHASRPTVETELDNLCLAGDWVRLPFPAMLMEAAYSSGLLAANAICRREGLREEAVWTVPTRGFMAGMRKRPF